MMIKIKQLSVRLVTAVCILFAPNVAVSQYVEGGIMLGGSNYLGDLSGTMMNFGLTKPSGGVLIRYNINDKFTAKAYLGYGRIAGADSLSSKDAHKLRNLSFYTDIFEASLQMEYNLIPYSFKYNARRPWVPYVFFGVGLFNYNPKTFYNGEVYELQPLATEGQETTQYNDKERYNLTQFVVPFGFGIKKRIHDRWSIGAELGFRYTFTNYLDDVGGTYANLQVLERGKGPLSAILSDRSAEKNMVFDPEKNATVPVALFAENAPRSNKKYDVNDIYVFVGINITYRLKRPILCPNFN
jgi:hypothetical protein